MKDVEIEKLIQAEARRQSQGLEMIPSENHTSKDVMAALGSPLTDKYSEGYPGKRYYGGCEFVDAVENIARDRAKALFGVDHANVQAYSGSPANQAIYFALVDPGDTAEWTRVLSRTATDPAATIDGWRRSFRQPRTMDDIATDYLTLYAA